MKTKTHLAIIILLLLPMLTLEAQHTPKEKAFVKSLIKAEFGEDMQTATKLNLDEAPYSVTLGEEGDKYIVSFYVISHQDLNDDGVNDYLIYRISEGMLGGNANTNNQYIFYIMKDDREIHKVYEILGYAPFSYHIIEDASFEDKQLKIDIRQNFRTYFVDIENLKTTSLTFEYKGDNLYEESYLTGCEMAKMKDKRIFKADVEDVERELNMDMNNYTETSSEKYVSDDMTINAWLSGCDNLILTFSSVVKIHDQVRLTNTLYKKYLLDFLRFTKDNTRYGSLIGKILDNYESVEDRPNADIDIKFDDTWSVRIGALKHNEETKTLHISMTIENIINHNQEDNWDITVRRKE